MSKHASTKLGFGIRLDKFAGAKKSTYDKRAIKAKQAALNAKKVNKYRKLVKKLEDQETTPQRLAKVLPPCSQNTGFSPSTHPVFALFCEAPVAVIVPNA